jgi:hypothetical protein
MTCEDALLDYETRMGISIYLMLQSDDEGQFFIGEQYLSNPTGTQRGFEKCRPAGWTF